MIVDFLSQKLKVGGVLYISYNTQPGWAAMVPVRELLTQHTQTLGASGHTITGRIDQALEFAQQLLNTNPQFAQANPQIVQRIEKLQTQNRNYLAHEYFNRDWQPMSFQQMGDWLQQAKLQFAGSARYLDHLDMINLTQEQQELLNSLPQGNFRQTVRDFMVNQQFRADYWVKGARPLTPLQQAEGLRAQRVVLVADPDNIELKVKGNLGEADLQADIYPPLIQQLSDHQPHSLGQLEQHLPQLNFAQLNQAILVLLGKGVLAPVQDSKDSKKAKSHSKALNQHLMDLARSQNDITTLASPITGGGITLGRFEQLFLLAYSQGHKTPKDWAQQAWQTLASQGQALIKDGQALQTPEDNLAELTQQAEAFKPHLPRLKALGVI